MTTDQIISLLSTQGLAILLVIGGGLWAVRVLIPRYLDGIKNEVTTARVEAKQSLLEQTGNLGKRLDSNTDAVEVLSALIYANIESTLTPEQFAQKLTIVRAMRRKINGVVGQ